MTDTQLHSEFRDYLERANQSNAPWQASVLTFEEFRAALGRWEREYHPAWISNDHARMEELERSLLL